MIYAEQALAVLAFVSALWSILQMVVFATKDQEHVYMVGASFFIALAVALGDVSWMLRIF
jgi:hypothetical protein